MKQLVGNAGDAADALYTMSDNVFPTDAEINALEPIDMLLCC